MGYQESLRRLLSIDPMLVFQANRLEKLVSFLGYPEKDFQVLHVAGTNGKGSTCAFLDSILEEAGISRGRYTSPHLQCARERILINGQFISELEFSEVESIVNNACIQISENLTFFERMTAMAFLAFQRAGIQVAVVEVGLGGRLDATNIVQPKVCGITRIDIDHAHILGSEIRHIAAEKAGIIKTNVPVVSDSQEPEAAKVIQECAFNKHAPLWQIGNQLRILQTTDGMSVLHQDQLILPACKPALVGAHQIHNAAIASMMIELSGLVPNLNTRALGIEKAKWPGRYETVRADPLVILDGAHNPAGMRTLLKTMKEDERLAGKPIIFVVGMTEGHDVDEMTNVWRNSVLSLENMIVTQAKVPRALPAEKVAEAFLQAGFKQVQTIGKSSNAVEKAIALAQEKNGSVLIAGSLYLVGEARSLFCEMPRDEESPHY